MKTRNKEPVGLKDVATSLEIFSHDCVPARFTQLLKNSEALHLIAEKIISLEAESERELAADSFIRGAFLHFNTTVYDSFSMRLLEDEDLKRGKVSQLAQALNTPQHRLNFLLARSCLCEAALCGHLLQRNRESLSLWSEMVDISSRHPSLSSFAPPLPDPDILLRRFTDRAEQSYRQIEEQGLSIVDIEGPFYRSLVEAGFIWLKLVQEGSDRVLIERARRLVHKVLYFLQSPPGERWILQPYRFIQPTDSLREILNEILRHHLETPHFLNDPDFVKFFPTTDSCFVLTEGRIRKRRYFVTFPPLSCFCGKKNDSADIRDAAANALLYIRNHLDDIPQSNAATHVQMFLSRIEELQRGEDIKTASKKFGVGITANAIALAVCDSFQLPSEARGIIAVFVNALMPLLWRGSN